MTTIAATDLTPECLTNLFAAVDLAAQVIEVAPAVATLALRREAYVDLNYPSRTCLSIGRDQQISDTLRMRAIQLGLKGLHLLREEQIADIENWTTDAKPATRSF